MEKNQATKKITRKNAVLIAALAIAAVAIVLLITQVLIPRNEYLLAEDMIAAGQHGKAVTAFRELGDYSDSAARAEALMEENPALPFALAQPGEIVAYGAYEQDGNASNGAEPIEWIVLTQEDHRVLAVSRDILDAKQYHLYESKTLPQLSALTKWLKLDFADIAFEGKVRTAVESAGLLEQEYVAALEETKVSANVTAYAKANGAADGTWWLYENQSFEEAGNLSALTAGGSNTAPMTEIRGVRPAIWVLTNNNLLSENEQAIEEALQMRENSYQQGLKLKTMFEFESAAQTFSTLGDYKDAQALYLECSEAVEGQGLNAYDLQLAMETSIAEACALSADVTDTSLRTKELKYICSTYNPYCGSFTFTVDGVQHTVESDFCYNADDQCVYWICRQGEDGPFMTEKDGKPVNFFATKPAVYGMVATAQIGAEEVKVTFKGDQLIAHWGEYQSIEVDEDGNVISREDYQALQTVSGTKK